MGDHRDSTNGAGTPTTTECDPVALGILEGKIIERAGRQEFITYSELFSGVEFVMPSVWPTPHYFDVHTWPHPERTIATHYLRTICERSKERFGLMATAIVVAKETMRPSEAFFQLAEEAKCLRPGSRETTRERFWAKQVKMVHEHYREL